MSFAPIADLHRNLIAGCFTEAEIGNHFEYSRAADGEFVPFAGFDHKVYCGPLGEFRWAKVIATRAYICTDEAADGSPVIDRWVIRNHRICTRS